MGTHTRNTSWSPRTLVRCPEPCVSVTSNTLPGKNCLRSPSPLSTSIMPSQHHHELLGWRRVQAGLKTLRNAQKTDLTRVRAARFIDSIPVCRCYAIVTGVTTTLEWVVVSVHRKSAARHV